MSDELPGGDLVVATWVRGHDMEKLRDVLVDELNALARPFRVHPPLFDDGLELFVDARSYDDVERIRGAVADACSRVAGATVDGQWTFRVG